MKAILLFLLACAVAFAASAPTIIMGRRVTVGSSTTFTVAATGNPTYQWRKDGDNLSGKTSTTLTLTNIQLGDAGIYDCVATNAYGSTTSQPAALLVDP